MERIATEIFSVHAEFPFNTLRVLQRTRQAFRVRCSGKSVEEKAHRGNGAELLYAAWQVRHLRDVAGCEPHDRRGGSGRDGARGAHTTPWRRPRDEVHQGVDSL